MGLRTARPAAMPGGLLFSRRAPESCYSKRRRRHPAARVKGVPHERVLPLALRRRPAACGSAFLYGGAKLAGAAWTLKTSGEETTATIERVEVREAHVRKDDAPAIVRYYTEVVSFTSRTARRPRRGSLKRTKAKPAGARASRSKSATAPTNPSVAAPAQGSTLGIQGALLIIAGLALLAFGARWTVVKLL